MSMKAICNIYSRIIGLAQAARVTGGSPYNATALDCANVIENKIDFEFGAYTDGTHTPKLQDSADNSTFADVAAGDQVGTLTAVSSSAGQNATQSVSYIGSKRYVRGVITTSGTTTGAIIGVSYQVKKRKLN